MNSDKQQLVLSVAEPKVVRPANRSADLAEPQKAACNDVRVKVKVRCKKCDHEYQIDFFPYAPHPIWLLTDGALLKPYLFDILTDGTGPFPELVPCEPPNSVEKCWKCQPRKPLPKEGDTFKARAYRGKFKTIGREGASPVPENLPDRTYDRVDQTLTVNYLTSRYGRGLDDANRQSAIREELFSQEKLKEATKILEDMSVRKIEAKYGIPRMTASRARNAIQQLTDDAPVSEPP